MIPINEQYLVYPENTLKDALRKIDQNGLGTVFLVDNNTFVGTITDGDIRRVLLKNKSLVDSVGAAVNKSAITAIADEYVLSDIYKKIDELNIRAVPVLSQEKKVIGLISKIEPEVNYQIKNSKVFIMAGGFGTRLEPFTKILPKPLIPFGEKTIIEHIMDNFKKYGFNNFILSLYYKANIMRMYFSDNNYSDVQFVEEATPLGTGGSLKLISDYDLSEPIMVANCDSIININFEDFYNYHLTNNFDITILGLVKHIKIPYGVIKYKDGVYLGMDEKPSYDHVINTGFYIIEPKIINLINQGEKIDMPTLIEKAKNKGFKIGVFFTSADWFDIGQWEEYKQTLEHFKKVGL